jgi:IS5 family transposase
MRKKFDRQLYFEFPLESRRKVVREYQARYAALDAVLLENSRILDLAHKDFKKLSTRSDDAAKNRNRRADYTSQNILRALIVHSVEQTDYRETTVRISESICLQQFCRLGPREVMDYTFLCKAFGVLSAETLREMNVALASYAVENELIDPSVVRTDTTVVETNIHYPTDVSLLWDCARVLIRLLRKGRRLAPHRLKNRFHDTKIKRLFVAISRTHRRRPKGKKRALARES